MGTRIKTFVSTGVPPNGQLFAGDLNQIQDQYADLLNLTQTVGVNTLQIGESGLQLIRYGPGEARLTGAMRIDGILRGLGGLFAGTFTTTQRDAIVAGLRPFGLLILNTTNNRLEMNFGTDAAPSWLGLSSTISRGTAASRPAASALNANSLYFSTDVNGGTLFYSDGTVWTQITAGITAPATTVVDGSVTVAKFDPRIPNPMAMYGLMMVEGVLPHVDTAAGSPVPQTALQATFSSAWDLSINRGRALIQGDDATNQGMYEYYRSTAANFTLPTHAPASLNRWDIIGIQFNDVDFTARTPSGVANIIQVVGTPDASAALGNHNSMAALPPSTIPLAYVLIKSTDGSLVSGQIEDQRKLAGPGIWGEDNHRYRLSFDATGTFAWEPVV